MRSRAIECTVARARFCDRGLGLQGVLLVLTPDALKAELWGEVSLAQQAGASAAAEHLSCKGLSQNRCSLRWIAEDFVPSRADSRRCALSIGMLRPSARSLHVYEPGGSWFRSATLSAPWCFSHVIAR